MGQDRNAERRKFTSGEDRKFYFSFYSLGYDIKKAH